MGRDTGEPRGNGLPPEGGTVIWAGVFLIAPIWVAVLVYAFRVCAPSAWDVKDADLIALGFIQVASALLYAPLFFWKNAPSKLSGPPRAANAVGCLFYVMLCPTAVMLYLWLPNRPWGLLVVVFHAAAAVALIIRPRLFFGWALAVTVALFVAGPIGLEETGHAGMGFFSCVPYRMLCGLVFGSLFGLPIAWFEAFRRR